MNFGSKLTGAQAEQLARILRTLLTIPLRQRRAVLFLLAGFSQNETAQHMRIKPQYVNQLLKLAHHNIKKNIARHSMHSRR